MSKGKPSKKTLPTARKEPKLTAKQKEHLIMEEAAKQIVRGAHAVEDWLDEYQRGLDRISEIITSIEPVPRVDVDILEELRTLNATRQGQLPGPLGRSKSKGRVKRDVAEGFILQHLVRRPHDTAAEVAAAVGCSVGLVAESKAWRGWDPGALCSR